MEVFWKVAHVPDEDCTGDRRLQGVGRLSTAIKLARDTGSELHVVHAISNALRPPYPHFYAKERSQTILERRRIAALTLLDEKRRADRGTGRDGSRLLL